MYNKSKFVFFSRFRRLWSFFPSLLQDFLQREEKYRLRFSIRGTWEATKNREEENTEKQKNMLTSFIIGLSSILFFKYGIITSIKAW